jgi:hypothetical protein
MLTVEATPAEQGWECTVEVGEGEARSRHVVSVRPDDLDRWGRPGERPEQLVARAFEFLLAREPASQILRRFDVGDIRRYFPEFDQEMR